MKRNQESISPWNAGYLEELREAGRRAPAEGAPAASSHLVREPVGRASPKKVVGLVRIAEAIRKYGHLAARIDPLGSPPPGDGALTPAVHGLRESDLAELPAILVGGPIGESATTAAEAVSALTRVYCSTRGYDYGHIHDPEERAWLADAAESGRFRPPGDLVDALAILKRLTEVEAFEKFLHRMLPGKSRFSIEGLDMLVPLLEEILGEAAERGVRCMLLGMAHRGRLNVLVHVLKKPYSRVMADLRDPEIAAGNGDESGFRGDVTYHMGARRDPGGSGEPIDLVVALVPNPSHLETIDPVVVGMARASGSLIDRGGAPRLETEKTLPVLVHGDASFPGQGMVAETLNLSRLPAYETDGTLHIIANNQLGFTTDPEDLYSTRYASDLAKGFDIPILHVNADDPEAVVEAARTAVAYRSAFRKDFVIDFVGYRRRGHNESDEPSFTHPLMYKKIDATPTVREKWAKELEARGLIRESQVEELYQAAMDRLREEWEKSKTERGANRGRGPVGGAVEVPDTRVPLERLRELNASLLGLPPGFHLHPKLRGNRDKRRKVLADPEEAGIDWAIGEELALASILSDGVSVRFTGQDVERGTFSQRHAVLHDVENGNRHVPLKALKEARASFEIENSPLSENAALGFELGYSIGAPSRLTLWEAQYGDFINGAQVVVDELIVSARAKWNLEPTLALLLPHGYEGQGPDHSSGRLERFLALAASDNLRVANPTLPSQYFHLLRFHAALLGSDPRPLAVFTPKALLRHPLARSTPRDLAEGRWQPVLDDPEHGASPERVGRLLLCSGKIYFDLYAGRRTPAETAALGRVEQLYPFPRRELERLLARYPRLNEVVWVQEEPENMGAWPFLRPRLSELLGESLPLRYVGREESPSPAEGSFRRHQIRQAAIVEEALGDDAKHQVEPEIVEKEGFHG